MSSDGFARTARTAIVIALLLLPALGGCAGAKRCAYEGMGRDDWQQPERVIDALAIAPGDRIADLGAGSGYFTFRLAEATGPQGRVYAVDVDDDMLGYLRERVAEAGAGNVEVVKADFDDPNLPDGTIDLLFTSNTYHHIDDRSDYFARVREDLSPRGRVAVVELSDAGWFARTFGHTTAKEEITREMEAAGYALAADHDFLDRQHFLVFAPTR
jgi:ubiquinone/menaquinone biosynthesis C-methylase UbiE